MTKQPDLEQLCRNSRRIVEATAVFIDREIGNVNRNEIESKSLNSLVSYVDKNAERQLVEKLSALLPGSVFLTEEETIIQKDGDWRWIIDPLDGTTNFLHQLPCFAVSVALQYQEKTVMGIVHEVNRRESFYAWKNGGAWLNGSPISVSGTPSLKESLAATGFPYYDFSRMDAYISVFQYFMKNTRGIRRFGAAAVDLAYTACGRFDVFFEYGLNAWDVAAGVLIVEEAGGSVFDFRGGDNYLFGGELVATNGAMKEEVMNVIKKRFTP